MGANHNLSPPPPPKGEVVSNVPKILKWEQITTKMVLYRKVYSCFQCSKDTKMGANHNLNTLILILHLVVSNVPKILKWEQITTPRLLFRHLNCCFQCSKDTKMGANHNPIDLVIFIIIVVSNVPKILKWEQITTDIKVILIIFCCFQCSKDTKMRANHNVNRPIS